MPSSHRRGSVAHGSARCLPEERTQGAYGGGMASEQSSPSSSPSTPRTPALQVVALAAGDPRTDADLYPLLHHLRPGLTREAFDGLLADGHPQGLQYLVGYAADGTPLGAVGYRVLVTSRGRIAFVDDLVTAEAARSGGVGRVLLETVEDIGREEGCIALELDSGVSNGAAHRFYHRHRMSTLAFHFAKPLTTPASKEVR